MLLLHWHGYRCVLYHTLYSPNLATQKMALSTYLFNYAHRYTSLFICVTSFQVVLGITALLTYVPTPIAASHQSGSLLVLSAAVWLTHELKRLPK